MILAQMMRQQREIWRNLLIAELVGKPGAQRLLAKLASRHVPVTFGELTKDPAWALLHLMGAKELEQFLFEMNSRGVVRYEHATATLTMVGRNFVEARLTTLREGRLRA